LAAVKPFRWEISMKKKLDAYQGKLTPAQIAKGMNAAVTNARRLAEDAAALFDARRFPTAASLAILSIEEAGKISILRSLALARTNDELLDVWKEYRSHTRKNVAWLLPQLVAAGARKLDDFRPLFEKDSDHPYILDQVKQIGFYTDCLGKAHWSSPEAVIDETLARMLVKVAKILTQKNEHTEKEIELWVEHIGPVWKKHPALMKQALVTWYAAMQRRGLVPDSTNQMEQFVHDGLSNN
jgi:AbiV family abortive infection protein